MNRTSRRLAFTVIELLVVIALITVLLAIILPSMTRVRLSARSSMCLSNLHQLTRGAQMYCDEFGDVLPPMRMHGQDGGTDNPGNFYFVGNGTKYRPRWAATVGEQVGAYAFNTPDRDDDRQDYDAPVYACPQANEWIDERNYGYGYNYQFLGNSRQSSGRFIRFPVYRTKISAPGDTVVLADAMGTAAGYATFERAAYSNDGTAENALGNHGYNIDPPRLTAESDHGTGDAGSRRSAVDPRHMGLVNVTFLDGHGVAMSDYALGFRTHEDGRYVDLDPISDVPNNKLFSGMNRDVDPPRKNR